MHSAGKISPVNNSATSVNFVKRIKTKEGQVIIALTHPCFRQFKYSYFYSEFAENTKLSYLNEGESFDVTIFDANSKESSSNKNVFVVIIGNWKIEKLKDWKM